MKAFVLLNAAAGTASKLRVNDPREHVREAFAAQGIEAEVLAVPPPEIRGVAAEAARGSADVVVAGGGDGTVSSVAASLVGGNKPLGILPLGTLNHFAKDLALPQELDAAIRVIAAGTVRYVDVGQVNEHCFINNSSIGIYPAIVRERDELRLHTGRSKWIAMLMAALRVLRRFPLLQVRLDAQEGPLRRKTPFVFVGNNRYEISLLKLGARTCLDRGELSLYVANCTTRLGMLRLAVRALIGRLDQAADFESQSLSQLTVETRRRRVSVALDGEVVRLVPPLVYRSRPRSLPVIVPAAA